MSTATFPASRADDMESLHPPVRPRIANSGSTRAMQEHYRQSQGSTAFFNQFQMPDQFGRHMSNDAMSMRSGRTRSRLGSQVWDNSSDTASISSRPMSTFGGKSIRQSSPFSDVNPISIAGLDLTDPWGYSYSSSSPYDALLPPPMPSSRHSMMSSSPNGSISNLASGSTRSVASSLRSVSPLPWSERTAISSPATSVAPSASSSRMHGHVSPKQEKRRSRSCNGLEMYTQASPLSQSEPQLQPSVEGPPLPIQRERAASVSEGVERSTKTAAKKSKMNNAVSASDMDNASTRSRTKSIRFFGWFRSSRTAPGALPLSKKGKDGKATEPPLKTPPLTHSSSSSAASSSVETTFSQASSSAQIPAISPSPRSDQYARPLYNGPKADAHSQLSTSSNTVKADPPLLANLAERATSYGFGDAVATSEQPKLAPSPDASRPPSLRQSSSRSSLHAAAASLGRSISRNSSPTEEGGRKPKERKKMSISFKSVRQRKWSDLPASPASPADPETAQVVEVSPAMTAETVEVGEDTTPVTPQGPKVHVSRPSDATVVSQDASQISVSSDSARPSSTPPPSRPLPTPPIRKVVETQQEPESEQLADQPTVDTMAPTEERSSVYFPAPTSQRESMLSSPSMDLSSALPLSRASVYVDAPVIPEPAHSQLSQVTEDSVQPESIPLPSSFSTDSIRMSSSVSDSSLIDKALPNIPKSKPAATSAPQPMPAISESTDAASRARVDSKESQFSYAGSLPEEMS